MTTTLDRAAAVLGAPLTDPVDLGGSSRSTVLRCRLAAGAGAGRTVVVKQFHGGGDGFVRELAGLQLLDRTPELVASDAENRLLVMTDLGGPPTLADLLLGDDQGAAWSGARRWARELGGLVGRSRTRVPEARLRLAGAEPWDAMAQVHAGARRLVEVAAPRADHGRLAAEVAALGGLLEPTGHDVVAPTDTCPDNALLAADGWSFLDLEGTDVQHPALVAAYTVLPFATCWCVFDPPADLTDVLFAEFTAGLRAHAADVTDRPGWRTEVLRACAAYVLAVTGWLMDGTLEGRPSVGPAGRSPSYRQLMTSRWRWAALHLRGTMPALADACGTAVRWAIGAWGLEAETTGYPAFAST
jgi:hypothetical protein